ncbi:hypothetical protein Gpo141_00010814 [Globisporangium polare]
MADADKEVTYSDDEFGSDYEAEYDADESEQPLLAPDDVGDDLTRVAATAAAAERAAKSDNLGTYPDPRLIATNNGNEGEPVDDTLRDEPVVAAHEQEDRELPAPRAEAGNGITATAQLGSDTETALQEAERIQHAPSVDMNEPTDASTSEEEEEDAEPPDEIEASARQPPRPLGQLAKPASIRSLSVPVVPAASLVDPSLLVPSNLRSTSVPVVPSNEIMGIHRQNSGRFRIETVSGANARHKSIVRLPSVEEMIDQGNVMEDDDESDDEEDSDGDSESDDATDTSPSSRLSAGNNSPKGRSSSFQKTLPPKISPVLRTKSQPFMVRLPSVIEVAAEEMQYIESMRDGESETKSNGDEKEENSDISDDETSREVKANEAETASAVQSTSPPLTDQETEPKDPEPAMNPVSSADVGALETTACVETKLQPEPASANEPAEDAMANNDPPEQTEEPDDDYEDDYDDPHFPDTTEQVAKLRDDVDGKQELLVDDEFDDFKGADETSYNDDEYEGETDDYADMQFEDESRRETELLLREAQLLIQKQHDDTVDRALLLASVKSESPDIPDQSEPPDSVEPTSFVSAAVAEAKVVEEELIQSTTGTELVAATAATNFENQYGGDDEFTTADDDDEDVEFAQYGSDANETEDDDPGDDLQATSPPGSPGREARRSPEKIAPYTPRVYVEEYEPPPPKAPVFRQKRVAKPKVEDARRKLLPVKSPPNLRIDLPSMDKTKRNWLFLNMFRHGDDVSKYEPFVPQLVSPGLPQSAGRPARPDSALQQTYASSQAQAIVAYERGLRSGRRLVQPPDPALRERERNWAPIKPHESAIPAYDSILDKFCTTVTSPVIQRQIYQTRHGDLSPQLAYVLEKRVERQWKARGTAEAFGAVSSSYKTDVVHSPSSVSSATGKRSP